jgi:hypothetical protein
LPPVAFNFSATRTIPIIFWDIGKPHAMRMNHIQTSFTTNNITAQPTDCTIVDCSVHQMDPRERIGLGCGEMWCCEISPHMFFVDFYVRKKITLSAKSCDEIST